MNEWPAIRSMFRKKQNGAIAKYLITLTATVAFDLTIAIIIGVGFAALVFIVNASKLEITASQVKNDLLHTSGTNVEEHHGSTTVIYLTGPIFFGNAERMTGHVLKELADSEMVIFSMRGVPTIDTTGTEVIIDLVGICQNRNLAVVFSGLKRSGPQTTRSSGLE